MKSFSAIWLLDKPCSISFKICISLFVSVNFLGLSMCSTLSVSSCTQATSSLRSKSCSSACRMTVCNKTLQRTCGTLLFVVFAVSVAAVLGSLGASGSSRNRDCGCGGCCSSGTASGSLLLLLNDEGGGGHFSAANASNAES